MHVVAKRIAVLVGCPKAATAACRGTVKLQVQRTVKVKVKTKGKVKTKRKTVAVSVSTTGAYSVKPGKRGSVKLTLSKAGRSLVHRGHVIKVSVLLTPKGAKKPATTKRLSLHG